MDRDILTVRKKEKMSWKDRLGLAEDEEAPIKIELGKTYKDKVLGTQGVAVA